METTTSDGRTVAVDGAIVDELVGMLTRAGAADTVLDDMVLDCFDQTASDRYNQDSELPEDDDEAFEEAHGDAETTASEVNNGGFSSQVAFLIAELGADQARRDVRAAASAAA